MSRARTSVSITMLPEGGANIQLKWSDLDLGHQVEASERLIAELIKIPDYDWLAELANLHFANKYCNQCAHCNVICESTNTHPFPYCFTVLSNPTSRGNAK